MATGTPKKAAGKAKATPKASGKGGAKAVKAQRRPKAAKGPAPGAEAAPPAKPSLGERFWHRIGLGAIAKEERAHLRHLEHEADLARRVEEDRRAQAEQEARLREEHKAHAAAQRKADAKAARELARVAKEEDERMRREAEEAKAHAAEEAKARRRAAAQERAAKQRAEAEAKAAKAEERRAARQAKGEARAREEELARQQEEAEERRREQEERERMEVQVTLKQARPPVSQEDEDAPADEEEEEGEAVEVEAEEGTSQLPPSQRPAPRSPPTEVEAQADRVAEELRARRSKPITIEADDAPAPRLPVGRRAAKETSDDEEQEVLQLDPAPPARIPEGAQAPRGLSIPEHFLLLALDEGWDERRERAKPGALGGALTGALLLELVLQGKVRIQRDRFQVTDADADAEATAVAAKLAEWHDLPSLQAMGELAKWLPKLLPGYKDRLAARGLIEHRAWRHLGMFYRSQTALLDADAQDHLRNKLARAIAGGGRPDAPTILSLGLLEASGLFGLVVPEGAQAYNRKRLNGLLAGKDVMGYKVDDELKGIQEAAVRAILDNVRVMTVRG